MSVTHPASGTVLPALPIPLPGVAPSAEHTRLIMAQLEAAYADAVASGADGMRNRATAAADRLDGIAAEHADRAARALSARDYPAAAEQASAAATHATAADAIRRAITGDLTGGLR